MAHGVGVPSNHSSAELSIFKKRKRTGGVREPAVSDLPKSTNSFYSARLTFDDGTGSAFSAVRRS